MGYRIEYGGDISRKFSSKSKGKNKLVLNGVLLLISICVALFLIQANSNRIMQFVIPGDDAITKSAFSAFVKNLQSGTTFKEAVIIFCREIILNA